MLSLYHSIWLREFRENVAKCSNESLKDIENISLKNL